MKLWLERISRNKTSALSKEDLSAGEGNPPCTMASYTLLLDMPQMEGPGCSVSRPLFRVVFAVGSFEGRGNIPSKQRTGLLPFVPLP